MEKKHSFEEIRLVSLSMFRKNFFGIFHGSISAKINEGQFIINKKDVIFDNLTEESMIQLHLKKDYRWKEASIDADIHFNIYKNISEAKYICYAMPPHATSYTLMHDEIIPKDYFGSIYFNKKIEIYDPKQFDTWYERAPIEIYRYMKTKKTNIIIIKGYGIYAYDRYAHGIAKSIALLENTCKLLHLSSKNNFSS